MKCNEFHYENMTNNVINTVVLSYNMSIKKTEAQICSEWLKNPLINPETNKAIKPNSPIYNKLKKRCLTLLQNSNSTSDVIEEEEEEEEEDSSEQHGGYVKEQPTLPYSRFKESYNTSYEAIYQNGLQIIRELFK